MKRSIILLMCLLMYVVPAAAQNYHGTTGLLHVPSAETDSAGTFRGGFHFLGKRFHPITCNDEPYNTMCYGIAITAWEWVEMSFSQTILKEPKYGDYGPIGYYNQDRHLNIKLRPLKEGRWWPAVAIGWDDVGKPRKFKTREYSNSHFQNLYAVASKHMDVNGHLIGAHMGYRYYAARYTHNLFGGLIGGISYTPRLPEKLQGPQAWLQRPRIIIEWDGKGVNVGGDVLLWRHLFIQAALIHGQGFMGGVSYHYRIKF